MKYASVILGKDLNELVYLDLENYFSVEREESDQVEFKSYVENGSLDSKISALVRTVAALLNSDGGILIWGAPMGEKQQRGDRKVVIFKGVLTNLPQEYTDKDWIISKIVDKIVPLPAGVRVQIIRDSARCAAVFEVDKSPYSPHQADEKYFMRLDGQTRAAPHHCVEALFNRVSYPHLEAYIKPKAVAHNGNGFAVTASLLCINQSLFPNEEGFNLNVMLAGGTFSNYQQDYHYVHPGFIYYGEWVPIDLTMIFPTNLLAKWDYKGRILVSFGGKTAPRKMSEYHIDFNSGRGNLENPSTFFSIVEENRLQSEIMAEKNVSQEERLGLLGVLRNS